MSLNQCSTSSSTEELCRQRTQLLKEIQKAEEQESNADEGTRKLNHQDTPKS
jgi:hypothetical protein